MSSLTIDLAEDLLDLLLAPIAVDVHLEHAGLWIYTGHTNNMQKRSARVASKQGSRNLKAAKTRKNRRMS